MEFIKEWVTTIVIFVLIATVIDFLLPNTKMHKYVKTVVGLLLITIIINPIFTLLSKNFEIDVSSFGVIPTTAYVQQENLIESQKLEIESVQAAYILEETATRLSNQVQEELMEQYGLRIESLTFETTSQSKDTLYDSIKNIQVVVQSFDSNTNIKKIENIEIVQVGTSEPFQVQEEDNFDEVVSFLADSWNVEEKQIKIYQKGEI